MENSKVSTKLTIGFSLVMILLGLIAALGLWGMSSIQGQLHDITRINNVESKLANQMADSVRGGAISIRNLALVTGPKELENEFARLKAQDEHYANAYAALGRMFAEEAGTTAKEHEMYAALRAEEQAVTPLMARAVALARANDTQAVTTLLIQELRPKVTTWLNRLIALAEFEEALNDQAATDAEATYDKLRTTVLAVSALALLSGVVAAVLITRSILGQLGGEPSQAQYAAGEIARGNLTVALDLKRGDQSSLMASLEKMRAQLNDVVLGIKTSAESIATAAGEIAQGNVDLSRRTEEQAASLEETASSMEEITSTVEQNTHNAHQGSTLAQSASATAQKGGGEVETVIKTMGDISESSKKVTEIITVVEAIAFQTNILALNAAVEAARAGEQGRGFAVVASEVRTLAQRSANAAKEIKDLISASAGHVATGLQRVSDTGKTMEDVVRSVQSVTDLMSEISAASNEQSSGIAQINVAISQMDEVTQQNAALVEQAAAAAEAMAAQADRLREAVAVFQVSPASNLVTLQSAPLSVKNEARGAIAAAAAPRRIGAGKRIGHEEKEWQSF